MSVYTKKGDKGKTSLYDSKNSQQKRIWKNSLIVEALGAVDELNSFVGIVRTHCKTKKRQKLLIKIQNNLFTIGSILAGSSLSFSGKHTKELEDVIDQVEGGLPVLKNFILPGGTDLAAYFHFTRSLTRKAERRIVAVSRKFFVREDILKYLNRLSDAFFMLAREANDTQKVKDLPWKK